MHPTFTGSRTSIELRGTRVDGAEDRQKLISGFDQDAFSRASVVCIGSGGIISQIAPTLVRKGVGSITLLDDDVVEASNLNRQRFYPTDIGENKAVALAQNLVAECIAETVIRGIPLRLQEAIASGIPLAANVAICGIDNNPGRVACARYFRAAGVPVIFSAVSREANHGYVFVQEADGPCIACLFPDMLNDDSHPCPGTPAVADILQFVGALSVYVVDTLALLRKRTWNYRRLALSGTEPDGFGRVPKRSDCRLCGRATPHSGQG
jgi:molybdopterin-synthase adenylyltransferase